MKFFLLFCLGQIFCECPEGWLLNKVTKPSGFCYKAFEGREWELSWTAAESTCNQYGQVLIHSCFFIETNAISFLLKNKTSYRADLVSFESENEQNWVYEQLTWNQNKDSWRYYWLGLNDIETRGRLEWVSTSSYKIGLRVQNILKI